MTSLPVRLPALRSAKALRVSNSAVAFHTSLLRAGLNESDRVNDKDRSDVAERVESHKQESLTKAKQGSGEWKAELASDSEQVIKHDKNNMSIEEMQAEGAKKANEGEEPKKSKKAAGV